ncbi:hypothetical protein GY15_29340 [Delftia sp. 670]|nr:hypothetical protein GY15_29340 [Delftia sp. 670]
MRCRMAAREAGVIRFRRPISSAGPQGLVPTSWRAPAGGSWPPWAWAAVPAKAAARAITRECSAMRRAKRWRVMQESLVC